MLEVPGSTRGKILISNSSVIQDYFHKSIILMVDHDKDGAFGLTLNKPTNQTMESLIKNLPDTEHSNKRIYSGGPVDNMFVTIVHNQKIQMIPVWKSFPEFIWLEVSIQWLKFYNPKLQTFVCFRDMQVGLQANWKMNSKNFLGW